MRDYGSLRLGLSELCVWFFVCWLLRAVFSGCGLFVFRQRLLFCTFLGKLSDYFDHSERLHAVQNSLPDSVWPDRFVFWSFSLLIVSASCGEVTVWQEIHLCLWLGNLTWIISLQRQTWLSSNVHVIVNKRSSLGTVTVWDCFQRRENSFCVETLTRLQRHWPVTNNTKRFLPRRQKRLC